MNHRKWKLNVVSAIIICMIATAADAQEPEWQLSVVAGGISKHLTSEYEPREGYTEQHSTFGLEFGQAGPGWIFASQALSFDDSYNESSLLGFVSFGYRTVLPCKFSLYGGVGAGVVDTSYYSGIVAVPLVELGWWRISAQGSYLPKLPDADSVIAAQFKFRVIEW